MRWKIERDQREGRLPNNRCFLATNWQLAEGKATAKAENHRTSAAQSFRV